MSPCLNKPDGHRAVLSQERIYQHGEYIFYSRMEIFHRCDHIEAKWFLEMAVGNGRVVNYWQARLEVPLGALLFMVDPS